MNFSGGIPSESAVKVIRLAEISIRLLKTLSVSWCQVRNIIIVCIAAKKFLFTQHSGNTRGNISEKRAKNSSSRQRLCQTGKSISRVMFVLHRKFKFRSSDHRRMNMLIALRGSISLVLITRRTRQKFRNSRRAN